MRDHRSRRAARGLVLLLASCAFVGCSSNNDIPVVKFPEGMAKPPPPPTAEELKAAASSTVSKGDPSKPQ